MRGHGRGTIETLPSGKFRARFRAPDGGRQVATFTDYEDAEDWLAERRIEVKRGLWQPPKDATPYLADYAYTWIMQRRNRRGQPLRPRTVHVYHALVSTHLADLGHHRLDEITPTMVRTWYTGMDHVPSAQANAYGLLSAIMGTAEADELIERNPCRIRGGATKDRATKTVTLSAAEVTQLADAMPPWYRALVYVAAFDCLRQGETFALRRRDVAEDGTWVNVTRSMAYIPEEGTVIGEPKSAAGVRKVATPPHLAPILVEHMRLWTGPNPDDLVFTSSRGSELRSSTLYKSFYPARAAIGRPDLRWHDLRHTGATMAAQAGATLADLMGRLGHSTVAAALRYQHTTEERDQLLAQRITDHATAPRHLSIVESA